jgi:hypothetical protein
MTAGLRLYGSVWCRRVNFSCTVCYTQAGFKPASASAASTLGHSVLVCKGSGRHGHAVQFMCMGRGVLTSWNGLCGANPSCAKVLPMPPPHCTLVSPPPSCTIHTSLVCVLCGLAGSNCFSAGMQLCQNFAFFGPAPASALTRKRVLRAALVGCCQQAVPASTRGPALVQ